ncbi:unnamed protein product [Wickerhamomyces anomalus]
MSTEGEFHNIKEAIVDQEPSTNSAEQYITASPDSNISSIQHHLFIKSTRPRYVEILEDPSTFHQFLKDQLSFDEETPALEYSTTRVRHYEPILGYENLSDIYDYSKRFGSDSTEVLQRLDALYGAIRDWDLDQVGRIIDNERFNRYLELLQDVDEARMEREFKERVIKRMIIEQISSIVRPIKNDRSIKEKEINLVILLNSD